MPHTDTYGGPGSDTTDPDRLLNRKEAAALLGYSVSTIRRLEADGILTPLRSHDKARPRYLRADLLAAMARRAA